MQIYATNLDPVVTNLLHNPKLELLELRSCQSVGLGNHWDDVDQVVKLLHELYVQWL